MPSGTCCVTRSVGSSIHSLSSTSFQVELGAPGGGGSSSPFLWSFLRGGPEIRCPSSRGAHPPPGLQKSSFFAHASHLALLFANLGAKMSKHRLRLPRKHHLGANIFQHSLQNASKTAFRTLQRRTQPPKNPPKVL